jgi:cardiolipin synthase
MNSWKTIPNIITVCRILGSPFIMIAIANDMKKTALFGCIIAGFSDWLDGYIAKKYDMKV